MPSLGRGNAVSDYEHLNSQKFAQNAKQIASLEDDEDSDFLPLKPSKSVNRDTLYIKQASKPQQTENLGYDNTFGIRAVDKVGLTKMLEDFGHLQTVNRVPVPMAWSPGMKHAPNPALFITPEKTSENSKEAKSLGKENLTDLQSSSSVPIPIAWSPGMVLKPNPALLVTPDKTTEKKIRKDLDNIVTKHSTVTNDEETSSTRNREKHTVRFDLPSTSSGEETLDVSHELFFPATSSQSPITLKGCELRDISEQASPTWKAFKPQKVYDPTVYSDESMLDDSFQSPNHLYKGSAQIVTDVDETTSDRLADKLQELLMSSVSETNKPDSASHLPPQQRTESQRASLTDSSKLSSSPSQTKQIKSAGKFVHKKSKSVIDTHAKTGPKAGPQFLKTPPSAYESKPASSPKPHVFREYDSSPERNSYSFPFDLEAAAPESGSEHTFARPEYNSTLCVRSELDELSEREIDVKTAVASVLTKHENKRTELNEKASVYTNRMSDQFGNLVDVEPSVDSLCSRVVHMRTTKTRSKKAGPPAAKPTKSSHVPPDLMEFLPQDLQRESPDFSLPGLKTVASRLQAAPHDIAFDLYRHNRVWQGICDY
ncbi:phosphatase 1, regulatory subunit 35 [Plakobranchus ocellatus]|uniref:Phosphatase 1, regulatory subunit 35 n=1 Tax=Plakobranchus ocellatus TaxID=259542 RepID=A0AAV3XX21_9GAST|nr:phosphatase 1, regulatory subunit 35 [Plakobranchus ocellatus]